MKGIKLPRNNMGLAFQGPQSNPKSHQIHLRIYRNHLLFLLVHKRHLNILKLINQVTYSKQYQTFCEGRSKHIIFTQKVS